MARINIVRATQHVIDHDYCIPEKELWEISWLDPDTGEYGVPKRDQYGKLMDGEYETRKCIPPGRLKIMPRYLRH